MEEILTIQEEIAGRVSNYLQLRLTDAEKRQVTKRSTESRDVYYFAHEYDAAITQLNQTCELDPSFAHNLLAVVYVLRGLPREAISEAERAGFLSPGLSCRITLGRVNAIIGNHAEAREILAEVKQA